MFLYLYEYYYTLILKHEIINLYVKKIKLKNETKSTNNARDSFL